MKTLVLRKNLKKENNFMKRTARIIDTDIARYLPIIIFLVLIIGYPIDSIVHPLSSILLLFINSLCNPIIN